MTQTAKMCKELITQGLENLVQKEFREQDRVYESTTKQIREFLTKMCILEPISTLVQNEEMFRLTHIIRKAYKNRPTLMSLDLSKIRKYKTEIFLDTQGFYNIVVDKQVMSYKVHLCPPRLYEIIIIMWVSVYGRNSIRRRLFDKFFKRIEKELLTE